MDFPGILKLRAVMRSHSQKVLEAVDTNDIECTIKPTRFALGSKHLQFLFNWIANHFGETSVVRRAAAQTSSGLAQEGGEDTDWIYYKVRDREGNLLKRTSRKCSFHLVLFRSRTVLHLGRCRSTRVLPG